MLFLQGDQTYIKHNYRPDLSGGSGQTNNDPRLFYALYPSDKGNILTLIDHTDQPQQKMHYSVCGNYIDIHVNFHPEHVPVPAGTTYDVNYICEIYGDGQTSVDQLKHIGLNALKTGDITIY